MDRPDGRGLAATSGAVGMMRLMVVKVGVGLVLLTVACSSGSPTTDSACGRVAEQGPAAWSGSAAVGLVRTRGRVSVRRAFPSTAGVLNRWDVGGQVEPLAAQWPSLPPGTAVTACWLDGAFASKDGRAFTGVLVETSGEASRLIVAGTSASPLRVVEPPRT